jgi:hypothetical protein
MDDPDVLAQDVPPVVQRDVLLDPILGDAIEGEDEHGDARDEDEATGGHYEILGGKRGGVAR